MKGKFIILIPAAVLAAAFSLVAGGQAPGAAPDSGAPDVTAVAEIDSVAYADSVALALAALRVDTAAEAYKHLKFVQYDGTTESTLFPMVIDVHAKVLDAMATPRVDESDLTRLKGILLDLDPLLIRGAVFYSSAGDRDGMNRFATACVDTRMRDDMSAMPFGNANAALYPSMVYCAASNAYNSGDYERALDYFEEYLDGDGDDHREQVAMFYGQACINTGQQARGIERLSAAVNRYPTNYNLLMITLQDCLDAGRHDRMRPLMERALLMRPDDEQLLNVQAALFEGEGNYSGALDIYSRLYEMHPESVAINRHLALCYYNLGADAYNQALTESDDKASKRKMRQSKAYLLSAASKLEAVVDNDPSNPKYLRALAMTYGCLGETVRLSGLNSRLTALGMQPVTVAGMPEAIAYDDRAAAAGGESSASVPDFSEFAREYADRELAKFAQRGEFEKSEDYEKRVSQEKLYAEYERLWRAAEAEYLRQYAGRIRISDLSLEPYDVDNESYLINASRWATRRPRRSRPRGPTCSCATLNSAYATTASASRRSTSSPPAARPTRTPPRRPPTTRSRRPPTSRRCSPRSRCLRAADSRRRHMPEAANRRRRACSGPRATSTATSPSRRARPRTPSRSYGPTRTIRTSPTCRARSTTARPSPSIVRRRSACPRARSSS